MVVRIKLCTLESILRCSQYILIFCGILALAYCAFLWLEAGVFQTYESWLFDRAIRSFAWRRNNDYGPPKLVPNQVGPTHMSENFAELARRGRFPWGRLEVDSVGVRAMIVEGTDESILRRAVGHIPGTALPGQSGNVAIAGHRDTYFRGLRNIRRGDEITLTSLNGFYRYRVEGTRIVSPKETDVLAVSDDSILTLVTCYPFYFVGDAPLRFIVRAQQVDN